MKNVLSVVIFSNLRSEKMLEKNEIVIIKGLFKNCLDPGMKIFLGNKYYGRLYDLDHPDEPNYGIAVSSDVLKLVPQIEDIYEKKIVLYGYNSNPDTAASNIGCVVKIEVLDEDDSIIKVYA